MQIPAAGLIIRVAVSRGAGAGAGCVPGAGLTLRLLDTDSKLDHSNQHMLPETRDQPAPGPPVPYVRRQERHTVTTRPPPVPEELHSSESSPPLPV